MSRHKKPNPEHDATDAGNQIATNQGDNSGSNLPLMSNIPQSPRSPAPQNLFANDPKELHVTLKFWMEIVGLGALIVYTIFSVLQWAQIRWTNRLTREALNGSADTLNRTLDKMQSQVDATNRLYCEAKAARAVP